MNNVLMILAVLPSILLGIFIYVKDKMGKEPIGLLIKLLIGGVCAIAMTLIISQVLGKVVPIIGSSNYANEFELFIGVFIGVALVEEFSKWYFLKQNTWNNAAYDHIYDAIVYAVFVTLGFATVENVLYIIQYNSFRTAIVRAIVSVPGHVFDAILMGAFYGEAKAAQLKGRKGITKFHLVLSVLIPTIAHGFFDYLLYLDTTNAMIIFFSLVVVLYIVCFITVNKISKVQHNFSNLTCPNCGKLKEDSEFCVHCGARF